MKYTLPKLPYAYNALVPFISEEQLTIHHTKHHQAYIDAANKAQETMHTTPDIKGTLKNNSFQVSGHVLHSLFWENITPKKQNPKNTLLKAINAEYADFEKFKKEFSDAALSVEGSGWAALAKDPSGSLMIMQVEKHNLNLIPNSRLLLVLDVWEHAYYLDYKNARAKYIENFWNMVNWQEVEKRFKQ